MKFAKHLNVAHKKAGLSRQKRPPHRALRVTLILLACGILGIAVGRFFHCQTVTAASSAPQKQEPQISPAALQQIRALSLEKDVRSAVQQKLDSQLFYAVQKQQGEALAQQLETNIAVDSNGKVAIEITAHISAGLLHKLTNSGAEILTSLPELRSVSAKVALKDLEAIAGWTEVIFIQPQNEAHAPVSPPDEARPLETTRAEAVAAALSEVWKPIATTSLSNVPPSGARFEGDVVHRTAEARRKFGMNGSGVKIGVISDGVSNLRISQAMGHLGAVTVLPGQAGTGDEGTAMLEIVHSIAPGAQLYFSTAGGTLPNFAQNIRNMRAAGCDIILDDFAPLSETPFHDGQLPNVISPRNLGAAIQAVNDVVASGAMYFGGTGNWGNKNDGMTGTWEGDFKDGGEATGPLAGAGSVHDFGSALFNTIIFRPEVEGLTLHWADPLGGSANDYDLYVLDAAGATVVAASTNVQNGAQDPFESVGPQAIGRRIVIVKRAGESRFLHLAGTRSRFTIFTEGGTRGHHTAAGCISSAPVPANIAFANIPGSPTGPYPNAFNASNKVELLSADGPRRLFFRADGSPYTPGNYSSTGGIVRQKPDLAAADGVLTSGAGGFIVFPGLLYRVPFFGASSTGAHTGAIAALLKSAQPSLTNDRIKDALLSTAIDIEAPGIDRDSGHGLVMAYEAAEYLKLSPAADVEIGAVKAVEWRGNHNGVLEAGETGRLMIELKNQGTRTASLVQAKLTSNSPTVQVLQPRLAPYANIQPDGSRWNLTPFTFYVSGVAPVDLTALFTLILQYNGGPNNKVLPFNLPVGLLPITIASTLDETTPANGTTYTAATGVQTGRLTPTNVPSNCGSKKAAPPLVATGARRFDAYTFTTRPSLAPLCVTAYISRACPTSANGVFAAAYDGSFDPANPAANYLGDVGVVMAADNLASFSFQVMGGKPIVLVVSEVDPGGGAGCGYNLTVTGLVQTGVSANVVCLQDDKSRDSLWINPQTGDYLYTRCATGETLSGQGKVYQQGCIARLWDSYRLTALFPSCTVNPLPWGEAKIKFEPFGPLMTLDDSTIYDNTCNCP